ncbi:MAG: hypothetical protein ACYS7Y_11745 [Planctomycetota bacterium]|jgi:hypothetical protein
MLIPPISEELLEDLRGEQAYPICDVRVKWSQDIGEHDTSNMGPNWFEGLPEGRFWNQTGWAEMPRHERTEQQILHEAEYVWWPKFKSEGIYPSLNVFDFQVELLFRRWETWCIEWFSHWTWDTGQTDQEALESFSRYVMRTEELNLREGTMKNGFWQEPYCLMGAEDRRRWHGAKQGDSEEPTKAPCRCVHCRTSGKLRIGH